ncbi:MAG: tRNA-dihydrouridine synthase, partial [Magnetococcales bacterium]|nr:tRNA-dihydrouridine synthase [Magnetococcales bacterium]
AESITLTQAFRERGLDLLNISVGFSTLAANIPWGPAFLAPYAKKVRQATGIPVASSWGIHAPEVAERVIAEEAMDLVMIGRAILADPHYPYRLAQALNVERPAWVLPAPYAHWLQQYRM